MSLYDRLLGNTGFVKIPVHSFMAVMGEVERGKMTSTQAGDVFNMTAGERTEAAAIIAKVIVPEEIISFGSAITLTNVGATYDAVAPGNGLGFFRIQTAGISSMEFSVYVNKIGTGTQSWQLWNVTDAAETTVINDTGAAGLKVLTTTHNFVPALGASVKTMRVRVKSTTAADDPIFYGGCVRVRRIEKLSSTELHELLLLAEHGEAYATEALLKARLGIA